MLGRIAIASATAVVTAALAVGCATTHEVDWAKEDAKAPAGGAAAAGGTDTLVADADTLWAERGDPEKLKQAIAKWEQAAAATPTVELLSKISRAHYLLGDGHYALAGNAEARDAEYQLGLDWATKALKVAAPEFASAMAGGAKHADAIKKAPKEAVPAMYWYASNLGKWAASKGFATRLRYKDDIKATMDHVMALEPEFFYGAPWRYFGAFEAVTAGIAGGDLGKSKTNFEKSIAIAPNYLGTKVLWAELLCTKTQDKATYKKLLDEVIAADAAVDPEIAPENRLEQEKAKKLLAAIDDNFG
jgi:predicted anti-sigma-YlaC factor YlaD